MNENTANIEVICGGKRYRKADLVKMDPVPLRALFRERTHHAIEVEIYPILLGKKKLPPGFGLQPQLIYDVWQERGLPADGDDFDWARTYLELARRLRNGEEVKIDVPPPKPFTREEMAVVDKLISTRTSIRDWIDREVPDGMIEKILQAGRAAPTGCNKSAARFIVIKDPVEKKTVWSDIPTDYAALIVLCYDRRVYEVDGQIKSVPHNMILDCGAAADHMLLMAHALGLAGIWLTCTEKTAERFHRKYELPDYLGVAMHIAVGWAATGIIKSGRLPLSEMIFSKDKK